MVNTYTKYARHALCFIQNCQCELKPKENV